MLFSLCANLSLFTFCCAVHKHITEHVTTGTMYVEVLGSEFSGSEFSGFEFSGFSLVLYCLIDATAINCRR